MAYAEKRKNGSYRLRASCGYDAAGRQVTRSTVWNPPDGLTEKKLAIELQRALDRFQEQCDNCTMPGNIKFSVFADQWFEEYAKKRLKKSSYKRMTAYRGRTYAAIGYLRMDKITTRHIQLFINNLCEDGINKTTGKGLAPKTVKCYHLAGHSAGMGKLLTSIIPCAEAVSFQSSGTEALMYVFRLCRAFTGKMKIVKIEGHYHGWADEEKVSIEADTVDVLGDRNNPNKIIHTKGQRLSCADDLYVIPWNDLDYLECTLREHDDIAGVVMEPIMFDSGPIMPKKGYLEGVRELTKKYNVVVSLNNAYVLCEDISRTCAVDKAIGMSALHGMDLQKSVLVCSGRISEEIAYKALRSRIPAIVSNAAPTIQAKRICVHDCNTFFEGIEALDKRDRPKDFSLTDLHFGRDMVEDGRADKETLFKAGHDNISAVQNKLCTFVDTLLDPVAN